MKVVQIHEQRCKKCGICMAFCPKAVFEKAEDGQIIPTKQELCIGCHMCEMRCPDFAVTVKECEA